MSFADPIRYSPDLEHPQGDEAQTVRDMNATLDTIMETVAHDAGHAMRAVHAKAHAILRGTFTVAENLPPELAQGLFATPGTHEAYLRLSTNPGDELPDSVSVPRGLAIKILGAQGSRLAGAEGNAQDFILLNAPAFAAKNADAFLGNLKMLAKTTDRIENVKIGMSTVLRGVNKVLNATIGHPSPTLTSLGGQHNTDPLGDTFFSATPYRFGDYVAKFSLAPVSDNLHARTGQTIDIAHNPNALRDALRSESQKGDMVWEFRVQFLRDLDKQPIEDATAIWSEEDSPFLTVATLRVPAQDSWEAERVEQVNETMRFSVWTGLAAHQPLGNVNRVRRDIYAHSAAFRSRVNRCPIHEPVV